ncbi:D-3-phosphoglycerate dehydrogenase [Actinopolyspora mzabensis]|uniref:D-3-phosphoglycerate dehydrogenase n=1 Tax=Actinopolyspora mzabensis TaxID=995066 RepID=A0A1G9A1A5_ACTMZ|nr:hydroxyacid dehydrogenase [Actinopolyspora mzabensis]SDK21041.1 D-3-phosphoglycerate dehydrogenase [Actinopolyspora mzabensis]
MSQMEQRSRPNDVYSQDNGVSADGRLSFPRASPCERTAPGDRALRILVVDPVHAEALARLRAEHEVVVRLQPSTAELCSLIEDIDVLVARSGVLITEEVLDAGNRLQLIVRAGVGTDNVDLDAARSAGVHVCNVPGASANAVAELAIGLLLAVTRGIVRGDGQVRQGVWNKSDFEGTELRGRTLGLVGLGNIGTRLAEIGRGFGMRVVGNVSSPDPVRREKWAEHGVDLLSLPDLLATSDVVSLQTPLTELTHGLIGYSELAAMKSSAVLINVSRAGVVLDDELFAALRDGRIAGAGLDVLATESGLGRFAELDNVVLTPHIGAMTEDTQRRIGQAVTDAVSAHLRGEQVENRVH